MSIAIRFVYLGVPMIALAALVWLFLVSKRFSLEKRAAAAAAYFAFSVAIVLGLVFHEVWRDELFAWNVAVGSNNPFDAVWRAGKEEGHPGLWHFILSAISVLWNDPSVMQIANGSIAIFAAGALMAFAPFALREKTLIIFGYFFLFEYGMISRNNAIAVLLLFSLAAAYLKRAGVISCSVIAALVVQTNLVAAAAAGGFFLWIYATGYRDRSRGQNFAAAAIFASSAAFAFADVHQYSSHVPALTSAGFGAAKFGAMIWRAFVPIPAFLGRDVLWNSGILPEGAEAVGGITLAVLIVWLMWRGRSFRHAALFFSIAGAIVAFRIIVPYNGWGMRHTGFIFFALVLSMWIANGESNGTPPLRKRAMDALFVAVLSVQVIAGLLFWYSDVKRPFSQGQAFSRYMDAYHAGMPIIFESDMSGKILTFKLFSRHYGKVGLGSCGDSDARARLVPFQKVRCVVKAAEEMSVKQGGDVAIIAPNGQNSRFYRACGAKLEIGFVGGLSREDYVVYILKKGEASPECV